MLEWMYIILVSMNENSFCGYFPVIDSHCNNVLNRSFVKFVFTQWSLIKTDPYTRIHMYIHFLADVELLDSVFCRINNNNGVIDSLRLVYLVYIVYILLFDWGALKLFARHDIFDTREVRFD